MSNYRNQYSGAINLEDRSYDNQGFEVMWQTPRSSRSRSRSPHRYGSQNHLYHKKLRFEVREGQGSTELNERDLDSRDEPDLRTFLLARSRNYDNIQNFPESLSIDKLQKEWNEIRKIDMKKISEICIIHKENDNLSREMDRYSTRGYYDLINEKQQIEEQLYEITKENFDLKELNKNWQTEQARLLTENEELQRRISEKNLKFEEENKKFSREINQYSRANYDLINKKSQMCDNYERKLTDLQTKFQHIETQLSEQTKEKAELIENNKHLKNDVAKLLTKSVGLQKQFSENNNKHKEKHSDMVYSYETQLTGKF